MTIDLDTLEAFAGMSVDEIEAILNAIDNDDPRKRELDQILNADDRIWRPLPGPQFMAATSPADIVGFGGAAGGGKAQKVDAAVFTPRGYVEMGSLGVGDRVIAPSGAYPEIIGVYPQGVQQLYRIMFTDGASTEATAEHLWLYRPVNGVFDFLCTTSQLQAGFSIPNHASQHWRVVKSVEPSRMAEAQCIKLNSAQGLYITNDGIVTHNTDLGVGLAMTEHRRSFIVRQEATQLGGIVDRIAEILGTRDGYNGQERVFRLPHRLWKSKKMNMQIDFGSVPNPGDETKYQGRPKDLLVLDEATNIAEKQARFLMGWVRTTDFGQRTRVLMTFNPPTDAAGRWVIEFFGPWLDERHPMPAEPGELRWFATVNGRDLEMPDKRKFVMVKGRIIYDYDPKDFSKDQVITPLSRTFIPSRITDNPYLAGTGYMATLQGLPEPLRSQMLYGDFKAGVEDSAWQVIPTAWVEAAMARWVRPLSLPPMDSMGIDVARGGKDNTVLARRHGMWFDQPLKYPGKATPDGPATAGLAVANNRDNAPMHIDVVGVGSSPYDFLRHAKQQVIPINGAETSGQTDQSGKLRFGNLRTQLWWRMREALDPVNNTGIALPVDRQLLTELCAPEWKPSRLPTIYVESREEIIKRIGRSPDLASAYIMALLDTPKASSFASGASPNARGSEYDPYANLMR